MNAPDQNDAPVLRLAGVRHAGLEPASLELAAGEMAFISGPSGSGKSRLLRAVADLDPHQGDIWIDGVHRDSLRPSEWRRRVGWLPTESHWWRKDPAGHFAMPPETGALAALNLDPGVLKRPVDQLSTGERQRLALLRLMANNPRVMLLDEPTASLDDDSAALVENRVRQYLKDTGGAVIWVSHDEDQRKRLASRRYLMRSGHLEAETQAS